MSAPPRRYIAHLDMDAFYASVELLRYPELRGSAVVIGGGRRHQPVLRADGRHDFARLRDYTGRGVLTTSTYEARALGVFSGMGTMKAALLAPDAVLLPVDFDQYRIYSQRFKAAVFEATGLVCSVGVSPNKLLSKICSDLDKPDGLTLLDQSEIPARIWPLPARKINGIGPKAAAKLAGLGIHSIGDLAGAEPAFLLGHFGRSTGAWLFDAAHGRDERLIVTCSEPKSISRETTFERDLHAVRDRAELGAIFTDLCVRLAGDLQRKGYVGRTIGIKLRYDDFRTATRDVTVDHYTADAKAIRHAAGQCLKRVDLTRRLRLLGVRVGKLAKAGSPQTRVAQAAAAAQATGHRATEAIADLFGPG